LPDSSTPQRNQPEKVVFVGGVPRAGTTITHALLCTGPGVAPYHPEISFFRGLPDAYRIGLLVWDDDTHAFFADKPAFAELMRDTARSWLRRISAALDHPQILCLKDPHLTPLFPFVHELLPQEAWFVTVCRHPYDVVRSRQQVHEKRNPAIPFGEAQVAAVAREYLAYYHAILAANFAGRHIMFRYEDLTSSRVQERLAGFLGLVGFQLENLWRTPSCEPIAPTKGAAHPWGSPKYFQGIDLEPRLDPLAREWRGVVKSICQPIMARMGYD